MKTILVHISIAICIINVSLSQSNSSQLLDIELSNVTVKEVFKTIENQSTYTFAFNENLSELNSKVTISAKQKPLETILNQVLINSKLGYKIFGNQISIFEKPEENQTNKVSISGRIRNKSNNKAVPFVNFYVPESSYGTASNSEGNYTLYVLKKDLNQKVIISCIGFHNDTISFQKLKQNPNLLLTPSVNVLTQFDVAADGLDPEKIIKDVIRNKKDNYPSQGFNSVGYYKESTSLNGKCLKFNDAYIKMYNPSYQFNCDTDCNKAYNIENNIRTQIDSTLKQFYRVPIVYPNFRNRNTHSASQLQVVESRVSDLQEQYIPVTLGDTIQIEYSKMKNVWWQHKIGGNPKHLMENLDLLMYSLQIFDSTKLSKYELNFEKVETYKGRRVYLISYKTEKTWKKKEEIEGLVKIDILTNAVMELSFTVTDNSRKANRSWFTQGIKPKDRKKKFNTKLFIIKKQLTLNSYSAIVTYKQNQNTWLPNKIEVQKNYLEEGNDISEPYFRTVNQSLFFENHKIENATKIEKEQRYGGLYFNTNLDDYTLSYNPEFWEDYENKSFVGPTEKERRDLESELTLNQQYERRFIKDTNLLAPVAKVVPTLKISHGDTLVDNYQWLSKKSDSAVINYLKKENNFTNNHLIPLRKAQREIFYELLSRNKAITYSDTTLYKGYYYYSEYSKKTDYEIIYRKKDTLNSTYDTILDVNKLAKGHDYFSIENITISPNNRYLTVSIDTIGNLDNYTIFKDLVKDSVLPVSLQNVVEINWKRNNKELYFTAFDSITKNINKVFEQNLFDSTSLAKLIYSETDNTFDLSIGKSKDENTHWISRGNGTENEIWKIEQNLTKTPIIPITNQTTYSISTNKNGFYLILKDSSNAISVYFSDSLIPNIENWKLISNRNKNKLIKGFIAKENHLIFVEETNQIQKINVLDLKTSTSHYLDFDTTQLYSFAITDESEIDSLFKIYYYTPLNSPKQYQFNVVNKEKRFVKQNTPNNYNEEEYSTKRVFSIAKDGTEIPITLVYKNTFKKPKFIYMKSYGAYGINTDESFSTSNLPILDRGGILAFVHVRGGSELGKEWYNKGKMEHKMNSFTDFISATKYLQKEYKNIKSKTVIEGGSAGGLLMGAVINMRPELYQVAILNSPFVDALTTMLDDSLPLTTGEYNEWGNPNIFTDYDNIKSYSPYENLTNQNYPSILINIGHNDSQVQYWESVKYMAKLREISTGNSIYLLNVNFNSGHSGGTSYTDKVNELAQKYTFVFDMLNLEENQNK